MAISAAITDIVEAMKGADGKLQANPSGLRTIMSGFISGMVATAYPRTKSDWTGGSDWTSRSAAGTGDPYVEESRKIADAWGSMDDARKLALINNYYKNDYWVDFFSRMYIPNKQEMKAKAPEFFEAVYGGASQVSPSESESKPPFVGKLTPMNIDETEGEDVGMPSNEDLFTDILKRDEDAPAKKSKEAPVDTEQQQAPQRPGKVEPRRDEFNSANPEEAPARKI
jgi:hypothetical protein